jgi:hypothetical protein
MVKAKQTTPHRSQIAEAMVHINTRGRSVATGTLSGEFELIPFKFNLDDAFKQAVEEMILKELRRAS